MLTHKQLDDAVAAGHLLQIAPRDGTMKRCLYITPQVRNDLLRFRADAGAKRASQLMELVNRFITGGLMIVAEKGDIKRLKPPPALDDWNIRSIQDPPFRIIGYFGRPDTFVGLLGKPRGEFRSHWLTQRTAARATWGALFPEIEPHHGHRIGDYVTENTDPDANQPVP